MNPTVEEIMEAAGVEQSQAPARRGDLFTYRGKTYATDRIRGRWLYGRSGERSQPHDLIGLDLDLVCLVRG